MPKLAIRTLLAFVVSAALLLVSCGPKAAPTPAPSPIPAPISPGAMTPAPIPAAPAPPPVSSPVLPADKPRYGGTVSVIVPNFIDKFDIAVSPG